jgi:hypothetical protein
LNVRFDSAKSGTRAPSDNSAELAVPVAAKKLDSSPRSSQDAASRNSLLEKYLSARAGTGSQRADKIARRPAGTLAPLSPAQEELLRRELETPGVPPLYNECVTLRMNGPLDVEVLERSLTEVIRRHEIWRTTLRMDDGQRVQIVQPVVPVQLPVLDLREVAPSEREAEVICRVGKEVQRPFDFQKVAVVRAVLVRMDDAEHRLYLVAHQMVLDGMSAYQIFPSELVAIYKAFSAGKASPLPELAFQNSDFAVWHRERIASKDAAKQLEYWRKQLVGSPALAWPRTSRTPPKTFRGSTQSFIFSKDSSDKLKKLNRQENSTLFQSLLAGFTALLHRYTDQQDIVVGTISPSGRKRGEFQGLLGYFLNPVALRFNLANDPTFRDLLVQTRAVLSEAIVHDDIPIELLARELRPGADYSHNPFVNVAISLQPPTPPLDVPWTVTTMDVASGGSPWDLYVAFIDRPEGLMGRVQFNPDLFDAATIAQLLADLETLLGTLGTNATQRLSEVLFQKFA